MSEPLDRGGGRKPPPSSPSVGGGRGSPSSEHSDLGAHGVASNNSRGTQQRSWANMVGTRLPRSEKTTKNVLEIGIEAEKECAQSF